MPVRAVSFDFDNTLLLSEACKFATMREVCAKLAGGTEALAAVPTDARSAPPGVSVTRHTIFAGVAEKLFATGAPSLTESAEAFGERMCAEFSALLLARLPQADEVPGAVALLEDLGRLGVPCFVNSATPTAPLVELVKALGWARYFRGVYGSPGTKEAHLEAILDALSLDSSELLHVGDGDNDERAATEVGCPFLRVAEPGSGVAPGTADADDDGRVVVADLVAALPLVHELIAPTPDPEVALALATPTTP